MMAAPPLASKGVVLCADDFAVHASASTGIARLAALGRLSATSAMVLSPRWAQDAPLLLALRGQIDVGLHLDWTSEFAVASGHGLSLRHAMLRAAWGGFALDTARGVIERQLDAFEAQWRAPPDHVDGHQHVQQFAGIRQALAQTLVSRYGAAHGSAGAPPYLRISRAVPGTADLKSHVIAAMGADALEIIATQAGLTGSNALSGIYDFAGDAVSYGTRMQGWLRAAPARSIIMCHPALTAERADPIGVARAQEFAYLASPEFAATLAQAGVTLVRGR